MRNLFFVISFLIVSSAGFAQKGNTGSEKLTLDPNVKKGTLSNGFTYYIQKNSKPESRAQLLLTVNAGSILEDDDQQGLAHFVEHMAFNGIKSFPANKLDSYLESVGISNFNAFTSFDMTVYMLEAQTDKPEVFDNCMQIMKEWSHDQLFDSLEIDKERGVIIEEWRLGQGADERMQNKYRPVIFKGSQYAERLPIGKKEILEVFKHNSLKRFYSDWYRPDMMAIIAVGDFDPVKVEKMIKEKFSSIPAKKDPRKMKQFDVPDHKETLICKATDKEASRTSVMIFYKHPYEYTLTVNDFKKSLMEDLYNSMMRSRMDELSKLADPPFSYAYTRYGRMARTKNNFVISAMVNEKNIERGLDVLITENERVKKFGFTSTEFERATKEMMRDMEKQYKEKDKTESVNLAFGYAYNFLFNEPAFGVEKGLELYKKIIPGIKVEEINNLAKKFITDGSNMVVVIVAPEKEGVVLPSDEKIKSIITDAQKKEIKPYQDNVSDKPLITITPKSTKIIDEKKVEKLDILEWKLENGVRILIKPTDYKNDEIQIIANSFGGYSNYPETDHLSASFSSSIIGSSGLGDFNKVQLDKYLTGKIVNISPYINETKEGFWGFAAPQDFETALQLIYMYFTNPRKDSVAYKSFIEKQRNQLQNKNSKPENVFNDSIKYIMSNNSFRSRPMNESLLKEIDLSKAFDIFKDRFSDASDFTFCFVGNIDPQKVKPLIELYLGGLPSKNRSDKWKDSGIRYPEGKLEKTMFKGKEPKSSVVLRYTGSFDWSRKNRLDIYSLTTLLNIKLRDAVREEKGGTYGVYSYISPQRYPVSVFMANVQFGCNPDRVEELVKTVNEVIEDIQKNGASEEDLVKVKEILKKDRETSLKENDFWAANIASNYENGENILELIEYDSYLNSLSSGDFKRLALQYYVPKNFAKFVLMPEK